MTEAKSAHGYPHLGTQARTPKASPPSNDHTETEALIRAEIASIYSNTVPEHHGHAAPLPPSDTAWERARLSRAARNLTGGPDGRQ